MRVIAIQGVNSPEPQQLGGGWKDDGTMFTLNTRDQHMIAILPMEQPVRNAAEQLSIFSSEELPASRSVSPDSERDWLIRVATSRLRILPLLTSIGPSGWSGRTCPASCHRETDGTLEPSSEGWQNSGMGGPTGSWTLNGCEHNGIHAPSRSAGDVCSLSDVLETKPVPPRFSLSAKACSGVLRRAERRGKELPPMLKQALLAASQPEKESGKIMKPAQ